MKLRDDAYKRVLINQSTNPFLHRAHLDLLAKECFRKEGMLFDSCVHMTLEDFQKVGTDRELVPNYLVDDMRLFYEGNVLQWDGVSQKGDFQDRSKGLYPFVEGRSVIVTLVSVQIRFATNRMFLEPFCSIEFPNGDHFIKYPSIEQILRS